MKNIFFGSLVPLFIIIIYNIKHALDFYSLTYFIVYCMHLSGRPIYKLKVMDIYYLHRILELLLLVNLPYHFKMVVVLSLTMANNKKILLPATYMFFLFLSLQTYKKWYMYVIHIVTRFILLFFIILFELPVNYKTVEQYFHIRMIKNYLLAFLFWMNTSMSMVSLPLIISVNLIYYFMVERDKPIEREYFINEIPNIYPIPLDIKDAVLHCKTAKTLFKKQAI